MYHLRTALFLLTLLGLLPAAPAQAASPNLPTFQPDPKSVQRYGPAYRYPQAGWIVLHIEGEPYERGYQHGRLLAPEIAAYVHCSAATQSSKAPADGWKNTRRLVDALFLRRYEKEYLEEMKGIADGAAAAGARFDNRPLDLLDIVALNAWTEFDFLDPALEATPNGLEGIRFPHVQPKPDPKPTPMHCSAFAATGPATADGKIVIGHITMFGLYPSSFFNVWIDLKPAKGHRVIMQGYPGAIQSGLDYYQNDAGLVVVETTLAQTHFDINGKAEGSRIRQALQYANNIDDAVKILATANNGLYTNEWLLADINTNEIALFELGTAKTKLYRSSKNEWYGDTEGFYWGCNNTKDLAVRLETIPGVNGRPGNMCFCPTDRDKTWQRLYQKYKGKIDADFGKLAFTTPPLAAYHSVDAKFTTSDMARELKSWALFGPPLGRTWQPTQEERSLYPEIRPLVSNPWTVLNTVPPPQEPAGGPLVLDLPRTIRDGVQKAQEEEEDRPLPTRAAWHGTLLPRTDADTWLATGFAEYEKLVARENALRDRHEAEDDGPAQLTSTERERLGVGRFAFRSKYLTSARVKGDVPLSRTQSALDQSEWYQMAEGKGVLVLQELRHLLGTAEFEKLMDNFGREHAGKAVTAAEFQGYAERLAGKPLHEFFDYWLGQRGLPTLHLEGAAVAANGKGFKVTGEIVRDGSLPGTVVEVTVETAKGEKTQTVKLEGPRTAFNVETRQRPERVLVDKYNATAKANGGVFSVNTFNGELEKTLIVYGTADEAPTNREAAKAVQRAIIEAWANYTVPIKTDKNVTEDDLKTHHLILIGRPDSNPLVRRFADGLPVKFGRRSFTVRHQAYAHAGSAVIAAAENPLDPRYSLVVVAGLSAEATVHAPPSLLGRGTAEVVVLPHGGKPRSLVVPAPELVQEFGQTDQASRGGDRPPARK
jgi:hypothetical protein